MDFVNWTVEYLAVHEVFLRGDDRSAVPPTYATDVTSLDRSSGNTFINRVQKALSKDSQCIEMTIAKKSDGSFLSHVRKALSANDVSSFVQAAKPFADLLSEAQITRGIPGGVLIIFSGTVGNQDRKYIGAIKAEAQDGFRKKKIHGKLTLELLKDLFLTPSSRMYKIGLFVETFPEMSGNSEKSHGFVPFVYDHLMSTKNRDKAAGYFYDTFLGCAFKEDAPRMTKIFFEKTKTFIWSRDIAVDQKYLLTRDLQSYLRSNEQTIHVDTFAERHLQSAVEKDAYRNFMQEAEFPTNTIDKDTSEIAKDLRYRKMVFRSDIKLTGPAQKMDELVTIETIDGEIDEHGSTPKWTQIIVKDSFMRSE